MDAKLFERIDTIKKLGHNSCTVFFKVVDNSSNPKLVFMLVKDKFIIVRKQNCKIYNINKITLSSLIRICWLDNDIPILERMA
jgi:hypothetical protein